MKAFRSIAAVGIVLCLLALLSVPCAAQQMEKFQITYRLENSSPASAGGLLVSVYNTSGQAVRDVAIWIEAANRVTFDNHRIIIPSLADGQRTSVLEPIRVPFEAIQSLNLDDQASWTAEFTGADGNREKIKVIGRKVR